MPATVRNTYGALLLGAFFACCFSGIVTVQSFLYMKLYPKDTARTKVMVCAIWFLDTLHTCLIIASIWNYLIPHFGDMPRVDFIPWTVSMSIAVTAILTIIVHCFLAQRIFRLTNKDWRITAPILVLAVLRLCAACVTTSEMLRLQSFKAFYKQFRWVFTLGLSLSSSADILITISLCYKLRTSRTGSRGMDNVIDSLVLYTFENGSLTGAGTVLSMICWLTMPYNRLFLGLHFIIAKLYANTLLVTLNTRRNLSESRFQPTPSGNHLLPVIFPEYSGGNRRAHQKQRSGSDDSQHTAVETKFEINVEQTVDTKLDEEDLAMPHIMRTDIQEV